MSAAQLVARLRGFIAESARSPAPADTPIEAMPADSSMTNEPAAPAAQLAAAPSSVMQEVGTLARLFGWARVDSGHLHGREGTLALLGALSLLLWVGLDRLNHSEGAAFAWWGISSIAVLFVAAMILAWLMTRFSKPRLELRQGMLLVLGFAPLAVATSWIVERYPVRAAYMAMGVVIVEGLLYVARGLRVMSGRQQFVALGATALAAGLMWYASPRALMLNSLWFDPGPPEERTTEQQRDVESVVFGQSSYIDALMNKMEPRTSGKPNVFFVGFAAYGAQRVFGQEIALAARTVGERYGASNRSLQLANEPLENLHRPMATPSALRHVLLGLESYMNLDEDVLFLSLSSHGSEDARLSVESEYGYQYGLWRDLDAEKLAEMLRESKVRWKVIVISA